MKLRLHLIAMTLLAGFLLKTPPMFGHRSTAIYNMASPVAVTGTVTKFDGTNPPAHFYPDIKGEIELRDVEMMSLSQLKSYGYLKSDDRARSTVKEGGAIGCKGGKAKSGVPAMLSARS